MACCKPVQRRLLDVLLHAHTLRICIVTTGLLGVLLVCAVVIAPSHTLQTWRVSGGTPVTHLRNAYSGWARTDAGEGTDACDNISGQDFTRSMTSLPIDVVITWVNGSDPVWFAEMQRWKRAEQADSPDGAAQTRICDYNVTSSAAGSLNRTLLGGNGTDTLAVNASAAWNASACIAADVLEGLNRYRDNDELRFLLRSLDKYAPWVRRIHLVTNGQIPVWLNTAHPRVRIVTHEQIFVNKSHLPVFSSPAIEVHLHRIPGLSKKFIYFNDDVMLGADVLPDDFYTRAQGQKVYLSWEVPKCNPGCLESWLGDGYCDTACNTTRCMWDAGDCINGTMRSRTTAYSYKGRTEVTSSSVQPGRVPDTDDNFCISSCPVIWLGDKVCDSKCNVRECAWDAGDCGVEKIWADVSGAALSDVRLGNIPRWGSAQTLDVFAETIALLGGTQPAPPMAPCVSEPGAEDGLLLRNNTSVDQPSAAIAANRTEAVGNTTAANSTVNTTTAVAQNCSIIEQPVVWPVWWSRGRAAVDAEAPVVYMNVSDVLAGVSRKLCMEAAAALDCGMNCSRVLENDTQHSAATTTLKVVSGNVFGPIAKSSIYLEHWQMLVVLLRPERFQRRLEPIDLGAANDSSALLLNSAAPPSRSVANASAVESLRSHNASVSAAHVTPSNSTRPKALLARDSSEQPVDLSAHLPTAWLVAELQVALAANESIKYDVRIAVKVQLMPSAPPLPPSEVPVPSNISERQNNATVGNGTVAHCTRSNFSHAIIMHQTVPIFNTTSNTTAMAPQRAEAGSSRRLSEPAIGQEEDSVLNAETQLARQRFFNAMRGSRSAQRRLSLAMPDIAAQAVDVAFEDAARMLGKPGARARDAAAREIRMAWRSLVSLAAAQQAHVGMPMDASLGAAAVEETPSGEKVAWMRVLAPVRALWERVRTWWSGAPASGDMESTPRPSVVRGRRLADTYGDSLVFTNRLIARTFGRRTRKVPAHMPHMIDKDVMEKLQHAFSPEFEATSSHRFRNSYDVQYALAYFYFLIEGGVRNDINMDTYWSRELDTDGDGELSENELRTLASVVYHRSPTASELSQLHECVSPRNVTSTTTHVPHTAGGTVTTTVTSVYQPAITLDRVLQCDTARTGLAKYARVEPTHQDMTLDEVAFEMITDNYNTTLVQLDSIRARKAKFICVNDDMREAPEAVRDMLRKFYLSYFPRPSQFELDPRVGHAPLSTLHTAAGATAVQDARTPPSPWELVMRWTLVFIIAIAAGAALALVIQRCKQRPADGIHGSGHGSSPVPTPSRRKREKTKGSAEHAS